ncbi:LURP1-related protein domain containing protein [Parasponia andersonii]|uniref:LURP1-related protein domain containing protein n=1 Tax=Parasponia andersonii TaxID=3476 RepID=A0A2P5BG34_PARAD|nr:LURP1-related protein domain containing protein [Parasponia andersonii]
MTKVHPSSTSSSSSSSAAACSVPAETIRPSSGPESAPKSAAVVLTVWTKSLLFNCNGFTVYDDKGNLVFRVDNYIAGNKDEIVLMDAAGKSLLTIRRKRLSLADSWLVFDGEATVNPRFSVRKNVNILNARCLAHVSSGRGGGGSSGGTSPSSRSPSSSVLYEIEGSYAQRCCEVYDQKRRRVAEIRRKEAAVGGVSLGGDVFRLVVEPHFDTAVAMALVILLDQMFGSSSSSSRRFIF